MDQKILKQARASSYLVHLSSRKTSFPDSYPFTQIKPELQNEEDLE